jgi:hypothetical protein
MSNASAAAIELDFQTAEAGHYVPRSHAASVPGWTLPLTEPVSVEQVKPLVVRAVDYAIRSLFPKKYFGLCHVYAIVGASLASTTLGREYRPVAGMAVIDAGAGCMLKLLDNDAFSRNQGGAYHCWIESMGSDSNDRELIDLTFQHNRDYAKKHKLIWRKKSSGYLWGKRHDIVIESALADLPKQFPDGKFWVQETAEGARWIDTQLSAHMDEYVKLTTFAMKHLYLSLQQQKSP